MGLVGIDQAGHQRQQRLGLVLAQRGEQAARDGARWDRKLAAQREPCRREREGIGAAVLGVGGAGNQAARLERRQRLAGRGRVDADRRGEPVAVHSRRVVDLGEQRDMPGRDVPGREGFRLEGGGDLPEAPRQVLRHAPMDGGDRRVRQWIVTMRHMRRIFLIFADTRRLLRICRPIIPCHRVCAITLPSHGPARRNPPQSP